MKALRYLNKYFYKYRFQLLLGILFVILSNLFMPFQGKLVSIAVDLIVENLSIYSGFKGSILQSDITSRVIFIVLICTVLIIVTTLIRGFFMFLMRQSIIVMSRKIEFDLKNEIFTHYQSLSQAFYTKNSTGDLMARISEDVSKVRMYIGPAIMYYTNLVATFIIVIPTMFSIHTKLALWVLMPLPILSYTIFYVNNLINRKSDAIQKQLSVITGFAQETFSGIRVIKAFGAEKVFKEEFESEANLYKKRNLQLAKLDAVFFPLMLFLTGLSTIITISVGGFLVIHDEITIGNITEFVIYVNMLTWPVMSLGWTSSLVQRAAASQQRINEFLQTPAEIQNPTTETFNFTHQIEFKKVSYRYPNKNHYALKNISFTLQKGKTLAILGTTGSGKTTLVQLLLRVMDCNEGEILIDSKPLHTINIRDFTKNIGYAPQDIFLFSDTIANNIAFGLMDDTNDKDEKIISAATKAALAENIKTFKDGYQTIVGERGVTLSGGQKQRVSIARALIKNPEILVFDDCLSAVDTKTETEILSNLEKIMHNKTAIIISHRVSTVKSADYIIVLDAGEIIEEGTHENLMHVKGKYFELYENQKHS
ncbi:MAG: ABC transporter ATP-binding protein/permease [Bacteroidia bacterium]|nr:ABC transporter ATP-binding protein/permease [Bacteroidia bacterium]